MMSLDHFFRRTLEVAAVVAVAGATCLASQPGAPADPSAYLFDVPAAAAAPLSEQGLSQKAGWVGLEEDDTAHRFAGCAVLTNDKLAAVLPAGGTQLDVYSRQTEGLKLCARLRPVCEGAPVAKRTSLAVEENTRGSVALKIGFRAPGGQARTITYQLSAGAPFVETTAGDGVEKLRVEAPCRFAVVPDFFGDDMLVDAAALPVARAELPSENFLLHMRHGGEAIVMTVSESRDNDIGITLSDGGPREIIASEVSFGGKPHVWVAVLAGKGIWHERAVERADADKVLDLGWRMPFAAMWRVDWSTVDKMTDSWEMVLERPDGEYTMLNWFGQDPNAGQKFGEEFGARDWNKPGRKRWNPVLGQFLFPCWVDADGRGYLQPLKGRRYVSGGEVFDFAGPVVIYPIDRANAGPARTPIDRLTVVDLVRMTLGVGPCQYILDLEGQKRDSRGVATCYARDVINAIYKEGRQLSQRPAIEQNLDDAVAFIANVRGRIDLYVQFGHEMAAYLKEQKGLHPRQAEFFDEMLQVTGRLDQMFAENKEKIHTPAFAQQTADQFRKELLTYEGSDAYKRCAAEMAVFTSIGGAQDGLVASCRMIVKTLRQRAGIAMAVDPELADVAGEIRARTQAALRNPTAYEAPQH